MGRHCHQTTGVRPPFEEGCGSGKGHTLGFQGKKNVALFFFDKSKCVSFKKLGFSRKLGIFALEKPSNIIQRK